uniref:Uncharacterized protein n=1 Tax=Anguilla anguilla TaxID=7936 RepID=A0A0E9X7U8_ANGAN
MGLFRIYSHGFVDFLQNQKCCVFRLPVAEVALEGEQVLVEALDGLLLQDVVDAPSAVQHADLHQRVLLLGGVRAFHQLVYGDFLLLLLLLDLIGHLLELRLQLWGGGVGAGEVVERLPGCFQRAEEALLQVRAHPGQALLQLQVNLFLPL